MGRDLRIHPAIGIARVGNSADGYFCGPERVGDFAPPAGGYRDAVGHLKRQGARFRVFEYRLDGGAQPLDPKAVEIRWTVQLANRKAAFFRFRSYPEWLKAGKRNGHRRNPGATSLVLEAGPTTLEPADKGPAELLHRGPFMGLKKMTLPLGRLLRDEEGHLVVLGGHGLAGTPNDAPLSQKDNDFADQRGWYDDTSDGRVSAEVRFPGDPQWVAAQPAWAIVAPPKFTPAFQTPVTLYDALFQRALDKAVVREPADPPSFTRDIFPILRRAALLRWTYADEQRSGPPTGFHASLVTLPSEAKRRLLSKLAVPAKRQGLAGRGPGTMPKNWSDEYPSAGSGALTRHQYRTLERWANGDFADDWGGSSWVEPSVSAHGLDRSALEACVGAPLYPGIEAGWRLRERLRFAVARSRGGASARDIFRLDAKRVRPGRVTEGMSVPWHSDFLQCAAEPADDAFDVLPWWPAQRPIDVWQDAMGDPLSWVRSFYREGDMTLPEMILDWHRLGLVMEQARDVFEEVERG